MSTARPTLVATLQRTGIRRTGGPRNGFRFTRCNGAAVSSAVRTRLLALGIPPAWSDVAISPDAGARLQAVGRDARGRWQYLYLAAHARRRARGKFERMVEFGRALPALRRALRRDLGTKRLTREHACAAALLLLFACPLRSGNNRHTRDNGTFGIATLRPAHVTLTRSTVSLDFRGKHGVRQQHVLSSPRLSRALAPFHRAHRREFFFYFGQHGRALDLTDEHVNSYLRHAAGARFTAKDLRTWGATLVCAGLLRQGASESRALALTARWLGNTPAVARESYVHPRVLAAAHDGRTMRVALAHPEALVQRLPQRWQPAERALLDLLAR